MSALDGVFRCKQLGIDDCVVWWDAIGAVGTWAAAIATFLAVLLPYYASRRKEKVQQYVAALDVQAAVDSLWVKARNVSQLIEARIAGETWFLLADWAQMRLPQVDRSIEPTLEAKELLIILTQLRNSLAEWNAMVDHYQRVGGEFHGQFRDRLLQETNERLDMLRGLIEGARRALRSIL
ncbi:hypothetical protein I5U29_03960 [Stenotrophomonas maltophilia]|uniref:DUF4760 domain-containing protein n=1 Tax=Stenotrophomonas pavanii TaxID=487698 RepID=A0ABM7R2R8_9GAMM|nr:hypothetical protein [Stenotrophomonas pavanii]MBH1387909.1 hypothetical protein [Stenotrophomonas maltophilia]BCX44439.1 hypothetical protein STNY_R26450 [Stenotrophomonas pavanii]